MQLYHEAHIAPGLLTLNADNAKHIAKVLRMRAGQQVQLCDANGNFCTASIVDNTKHSCTVNITEIKTAPIVMPNITLAIAFTKNIDRIEWMLEKIAELGITALQPILCERLVSATFKRERLEKIAISAMCQSKQYHALQIREPLRLVDLPFADFDAKYIAHCEEALERKELSSIKINANSTLMLVGPEGDFTNNEIALCMQHGCIPVQLGETRLRTETAGLVACTLLKQVVLT
ncbi:MAG: hypothetical protein RL660_996 [Bacteroidota bacterium]|jgi:16S rRNA (uracil1498-N3)-methyltransferase